MLLFGRQSNNPSPYLFNALFAKTMRLRPDRSNAAFGMVLMASTGTQSLSVSHIPPHESDYPH